MCRSLVGFVLLSCWCLPAQAQGLVQLPTVQTNSVSTAVSVPDGGSALLGGVSGAASSQRKFGLFPFGSSLGQQSNNSSLRATASIHDFEAADKILLGKKTEQDEAVYVWRNPAAKMAWERAHGQNSSLKQSVIDVARQTAVRDYDPQAPPKPRPERSTNAPVVSPNVTVIPKLAPRATVKAAAPAPRNSNTPVGRLLNLGDRAMSRNNPGAAVSYYRAAARLGSTEAKEKIKAILNQLP